MVPDKKSDPPSRREYPATYEKIVPIALVAIGVAIMVLIIITIIVALGLTPG